MKRREFLALAAAGLAPAAPDSRGGLVFHAARHEADSEEIVFDAPADIDWEKLARTHAAWAFTPPLPPERLREIERFCCEPCGGSDVPFSAPLDARLEERVYYLINPHGIRPLKLVRLKGFARFSFLRGEQEKWSSAPVLVGGYLAATLTPRPTPPEGGFALAADGPVRFERVELAQFTAARDGDQLRCAYQDGSPHLELTLPFSGFADVDNAFSFRANGETFCIVRWQFDKDHGFCRSQYTLFEITDALRLLDFSSYNCDL